MVEKIQKLCVRTFLWLHSTLFFFSFLHLKIFTLLMSFWKCMNRLDGNHPAIYKRAHVKRVQYGTYCCERMWGKSAKTKKHRNITEWRKGMNASPIKLQYYLRRSDNVDGLVSDPSFTRAAPEQKGLAWKSISSSSVWSKVWRRTMNGAVIYQTDHTRYTHWRKWHSRHVFLRCNNKCTKAIRMQIMTK